MSRMEISDMSYYDPPAYADEALWELAADRLEDEWKDMSTSRVESYLASLEIQDIAYRTYKGEDSAFAEELNRLKDKFIELYISDEMDEIVRLSEQDAAEAYADYLSDR